MSTSTRTDDPGAARKGNFINYYQFNPPENRLKHIPADLLSRHLLDEKDASSSSLVALDVGCNTGVSPPHAA